jgi:hypothetical protein
VRCDCASALVCVWVIWYCVCVLNDMMRGPPHAVGAARHREKMEEVNSFLISNRIPQELRVCVHPCPRVTAARVSGDIVQQGA